MKHRNWGRFCVALLIMLGGLGMIGGCDTGEKVLDEVTGNRAVKQYHKSEKDVQKIADQQAERYKSITDEEKKDGEQQ